eukprot:TRINITY_DN172_c3_g1_i1.p1 TRINITY_DN172_c3_g1~~TRINITY_DN172_c3_g1_i1.p1  ORF type:complete len:313 (+),score=101.00 TRINITY_DN172_c3_g1_i1:191-1129(+)
MDCSIVPTKYPDFVTISTTDFFYPLVDDPYLQGKIGCANVLSDLYAMGVVHCDNLLMILAASTEMKTNVRNIVTKDLIRGFVDLAKEAETKVTGGQTVLNPWPIIGGTAISMCKSDDYINPVNSVAGDVLVLTKPLGTQVSVNAHQWEELQNKWWDKIKNDVTHEEVEYAYRLAEKSMSRLNLTGAKLMHKYGIHAGTDVTGFGILGHATNLAENQEADVYFEIHTLPIIKGMSKVNQIVDNMFRLPDGFSAETSGGLLLCVPSEEVAQNFINEINEIDGCPAWIIGNVKAHDDNVNTNKAVISQDVTIIEV